MNYKNSIGTIIDDEIIINNKNFKTSTIKAVSYFYVASGKTEFYLIVFAILCFFIGMFYCFLLLYPIGFLALFLSKIDFYYDYFLVIKTNTESEPIIEEIKISNKSEIDFFIKQIECN